MIVELILTAFVIVVILVGSGVIFRKRFAQIDFREDLSNNPSVFSIHVLEALANKQSSICHYILGTSGVKL